VTLIAGFPPGGSYDTYVRVLARHYGRFLPGQPTVVATNLPGAGSLTAANTIYAKYAPDGLTLAMFASSAAMEPLIGNKAALFDPAKFSWIGSMSQDVAFCGAWQHPGVPATFEEMLKKETIIGGGAPAAITYQHPMVLKNVLKANLKVIPGSKGTRDINIAMQRGEVHGTCGMFELVVNSQFGAEVKDGRMKLFIQMGSKRSDQFGRIPSVFDYAKTDEDRAILQFPSVSFCSAGRWRGPPGIPADRLAVLRSALVPTMEDRSSSPKRQRRVSTSIRCRRKTSWRCSGSLPPSPCPSRKARTRWDAEANFASALLGTRVRTALEPGHALEMTMASALKRKASTGPPHNRSAR
jgi:hypothetical protein